MLELRASKIGGCVRGYVMDLRSGTEPEITPRAQLYFAVGKALEPVIMEHSGYDPKLLLNDTLKVEVKLGGGIVITGHPDAYVDNWVIECKTMRTAAYKKMIGSSLFIEYPQYLIQGSVYCQALKAQGVIYLCLDKDASAIHRVRVEAWEIMDYWEKAKTNAKKIKQWLNLENLPEPDPDQPSWHCKEAYCLRWNCRHNSYNTQKPKIVKNK